MMHLFILSLSSPGVRAGPSRSLAIHWAWHQVSQLRTWQSEWMTLWWSNGSEEHSDMLSTSPDERGMCRSAEAS